MLDKQNLKTFVLGGLAGAIAGILLTPRSGQELRGTIASRAGEARERGRETIFEAREKAQERFSGKGETYHQASPDPFSEEPFVEEIVETDPPPESETVVGRTSSGAIPLPGDSTLSRPPLRDVSRDVPQDTTRDPRDPRDREAPGASGAGAFGEATDENTEDLRRRIEETRARLRRRRQMGGEDRDV